MADPEVSPEPLRPDALAELLHATGRSHLEDALSWIAEKRALKGAVTSTALQALIAAADLGWPNADLALRVVARMALSSTLDTSADLVAIHNLVAPQEYERALSDVADRTPSGSLKDIGVHAVGAAQAENSLVIETLALVAGLSWRDLRDRSDARGVPLPGKSSGSWSRSQISSAFAIVDAVVTGTVKPQLAESVAMRPVEMLVAGVDGWSGVEELRVRGVGYGVLLAQRDVGSAWSAHRNRTNTEISRLIVEQLLTALKQHDISFWSTEGTHPVPRQFLAARAVNDESNPGQLSVVTQDAQGDPSAAIFVSVARDGGTARKTAATFLALPETLAIPGLLFLVGTGWADRGESDKLIRAFEGRVYTEKTLPSLAGLVADLSHAKSGI